MRVSVVVARAVRMGMVMVVGAMRMRAVSMIVPARFAGLMRMVVSAVFIVMMGMVVPTAFAMLVRMSMRMLMPGVAERHRWLNLADGDPQRDGADEHQHEQHDAAPEHRQLEHVGEEEQPLGDEYIMIATPAQRRRARSCRFAPGSIPGGPCGRGREP